MNGTLDMQKKSNIVHGSFREGLISRMIRQIKDWNHRREVIRQLHTLSDTMLRDIGVERYQIADVVNRRGRFTRVHVATPASAVPMVDIKEAA